MRLRYLAIVPVILAAGCAARTAAPESLDVARAWVARAESLRGSAATAPSPEPVSGGRGREPWTPPATGAAGDATTGLLDTSPERREELRRAAAAPATLTALLADPVGPSDLETLAWLRSPAVTAAHRRYEAARTAYRQSEDLEDLVALNRSYLRDTDTRVGPERSRRGTASIAPSPNVTQLSLEVAERTVAIAWQHLRAAVRDTVAMARRLHADAAHLRAARAILDEEVALDDQLVGVLRARFESGRGSQAAILAFESRVERLRTERAILDQREAAVRASWNALLDRPDDAPVNLEVTPAAGHPPLSPDVTNSLVATALENRPEFLGASLAAERADLAVRLAETMTLPRMDVGSSRFERERAGEAGVQRGAVFPEPGRMTMPRYDFGVREAQVGEMRERAAALRSTREAERNRTGADVRGAVFSLDAAGRRAGTLRREVVPRAERALASTRAGYEADRESYLDLLDSVRRLLDARLGLADAERDVAHARAGLLESVGMEPARR